ncbi:MULTISPECIES: STAS domain-containing protein [unclassified Acinetobacter]|uniref:STAS domain-containing protein n=1 Tax=unclassified Acinetobacter TaxID=196816 RepID=UPI0029342FA6|nr:MULTISPECIES: STAS domain-containing protein [unclassified Acinetobacter]WOE31143.1 STAS domain-containing protein [Acinetobacter sp. SAAs470]WOE39339.1 STAS domain-containing protein [Acinetobacter sp. SAAs474]
MIDFIDQELQVSGKIDYDNAESYYQQGLRLIHQQNQFPVVVNLAKLEQGSTLALAVFIRLLRQTPDAKGLIFKSVPVRMMKIIQASHLEHDLQLIPD